MGTLEQVKYTLENLKVVDGDICIENIEAAIKALESELDCLEAVTVQGRENLDQLLGVMLTISTIIGKETKE